METFRTEVVEITNMVETAALPEDVRDTILWCLAKLPALYDQFCATYESRYAEEIVRLEQGSLGKLAESRQSSPLAETVFDRFCHLHERFGLPSLDSRLPSALVSR